MSSHISTDANHYGDLIPTWKTNLILQRAKEYGFHLSEWDEIQQDLAPIIHAFVFDPAKSNGGTVKTALISVIDRQLLKRFRRTMRYKQMVATYKTQTDGLNQSRLEAAESQEITNLNRHIDVQACLARLTKVEQAICHALADGESVCHLGTKVGQTVRQVNAVIVQIRYKFHAMGLQAWVGGSIDS